MPMDYNNTLNLPQTDFPMRAGLPKREPEFLKQWEEDQVYFEALKLAEGKPTYILHDGPPFSNGNIHTGTAMNKVLKDFINRYKMMSGYRVPYTPGWDNHGMPIESAIIKQNKLDRKKMSIPEFRDACHKFAQDFVNIQRSQFIRLGVLGDWENPYLTMDPLFEAEEVRVFGEMFQKGYIYKGLKPVYWCPNDETALAEAEIEYKEDPCTTLYGKFRVKDDLGRLSQYGDTGKTYFLIWTTTPWTLSGNLAIAVHPRDTYVLVRAENGESYILAEALLKTVMEKGKITKYEIVARLAGSELEYIKAEHPFLNRDSLLVTAEYVTMDSGTGCVHTAPGFGVEDYQTCLRYKMDMIVPVDDRGMQTEDAGKFVGMRYDKSSAAIIADMEESGALFAREDILHSYPHCWRCKDPVIFRATPQWFCSVEAFKEAAVTAARGVTWLPAWGEERMVSMILERSDWCISRQRHWGLPIPVFYCETCKKPVCDSQTVESVSNIFAKEGSNAWFAKTAAELLPEGYQCPFCGAARFTKETDILDCWFDSGSTHRASHAKDHPDIWPPDMYLEGADQYRGWFQSSLLTAVATGRGAPYKTVLTHGWVVDGEGKAMHKSLGNAIEPETIIEKFGADVLRLWVASSDYRVDVRVSDEIFKQLSQAYLKIRNTSRYILGNLNDFDPNRPVAYADMPEFDKWALMRLNRLVARVREGYEAFEYHVVYHAIHNFCVVDMSNFYLDVIKDRLYCDETDGLPRRSAQTVMYYALDAMTRMLTPLLAFTSDEVWRAMPHADGVDARHAIYNQMPEARPEYEFSAEQAAKWEKIVFLRDGINKVLESARAAKQIGKSLEARVVLHCTDEAAAFIRQIEKLLPQLLIVSQVEAAAPDADAAPCEGVDGISVSVFPAGGGKCSRCWTYSEAVGGYPDHPELCGRCAEVVSK